MIFIIIIVILTIFVIALFNKKIKLQSIIERYSERLEKTNFQKCAEFCKTTAGCYGFGYNKQKQICYPSKVPINGRPLDDSILYKSDYTTDQAICNKLQPITEAGKNIPFTDRRANSIFVCRESADLQPSWYLSYNDTFLNIGEKKI